ncbi:MAG: hypothetical protein ONB11_03280 [candidate division KSB1 bacterium]|nr:hypothetical protein [candidate division KSB1 bacterium]MDZ7341805.1 hypothetical protein [candidate division KSB1 bacterium]
MESQLTNLAEQILMEEADFIVPVKKVWLKLSLMGKLDDLHFENFMIMLQEDDRFEVFENLDNQEMAEEVEQLEEIGFYEGPRVMLKSRRPTRKELGEMLIKKTTTIFDSLRKAWELRDQENEYETDQLLRALASTQKLLRALKKEFPESYVAK